MKMRMVLVAVAALVLVIVIGVALSQVLAPPVPATAQPSPRPRSTLNAPTGARPTTAPGGPTAPGAAPTQDILDDSSGGTTEDVTVEPGNGESETPDLLDDSPVNPNGTRTPKPKKTEASRPPTITLAIAPLMPSGIDSAIWNGRATLAQLQQVKDYFTGRQVLYSWRDTAADTASTTYRQTVEHCGNRYVMRGSADVQASGGSAQPATWRDQGTWDVLQSGDQILLSYHSTADQKQTVPVGIQSGGSVVVLNTTLNALRQGPAVCE